MWVCVKMVVIAGSDLHLDGWMDGWMDGWIDR
jgi:hypothetical protein